MAIGKKRKFQTYENVRMALTRNGILEPGITASFLLELFLENFGKAYAQQAVARKLCTEGKFKSWRDNLVKLGWLDYDYKSTHEKKNYAQHTPGKKLLKYINKEKSLIGELVIKSEIIPKDEIALKSEVLHKDEAATKIEIRELRDDVQDIKAQMNEVRELLAELKRLQAPPPNEQAQVRSAEIAQRLDVLMVKKIIQ